MQNKTVRVTGNVGDLVAYEAMASRVEFLHELPCCPRWRIITRTERDFILIMAAMCKIEDVPPIDELAENGIQSTRKAWDNYIGLIGRCIAWFRDVQYNEDRGVNPYVLRARETAGRG